METIHVQQNGDNFSCDIGISKEEWLNLLKDKGLKTGTLESLLRFYYMPEHRGSCAAVSKKKGGNAYALNLYISKFGQFAKKRLNRFEVYGIDGKPTRWIIPMCKGRNLLNGEEGAFEWELRPELVEAIRSYLYWYLLQQYKKLRKEMPIRDKSLRWDELYKWELITSCQGKTPIEIITTHLANPSKAELGGFSNLIDAARDNKALKYAVEHKSEEFSNVLNGLADESLPLIKRLDNFKKSMTSLLSETGLNSKANDERTAATILTCLNPHYYTFYKHDELYDRFCKYLGEETKKAGECYVHYLSLLAPLAKLVAKDNELQEIVSPMLEGQMQSILLLAQDVLWMLLKSFPKRLEFIYNLLFTQNNMESNKNIRFIELLESNYNLILTGAPGTGKTYLAKQIAAEMLGVDDVELLEANPHYGFVQFHPSYDYTDFIEGLRPFTDKNGNVGFKLKYGVFKEFCKSALNIQVSPQPPVNLPSTQGNDFDKIYRSIVDDIISGKLKSYRTPYKIQQLGVKDGRIVFRADSDTPRTESEKNLKLLFDYFVSNHIFDLSAFQKNHYWGLIEKMTGGKTKTVDYVEYGWVLQEMLNRVTTNYSDTKEIDTNHPDVIPSDEEIVFSNKKDEQAKEKFIFIIDEINRGEISKIFGELFFSIDPGYRGEKGMVNTQYQNMIENDDVFKEGFFVPENVYIIGTMNDIDRSVESMDFAMRRRFAWQEVTAEESYVNMIENDAEFTGVKDEIKARMFNLNNAIAKTEGLNESYQIGAAYFRKYLDYQHEDNPFECLWNNHLKGLLFEYLRGNRKAKELLEKLHEAYNKTSIDEQSAHTNEGQL